MENHKPSYNQHPSRTNATFQDAEEEPLSVQSLVGLTPRGGHEADTPEKDDPKHDSLDRVPLRHGNGGIRAADEAEIEDGGRKGVAHAYPQVQILNQTK